MPRVYMHAACSWPWMLPAMHAGGGVGTLVNAEHCHNINLLVPYSNCAAVETRWRISVKVYGICVRQVLSGGRRQCNNGITARFDGERHAIRGWQTQARIRVVWSKRCYCLCEYEINTCNCCIDNWLITRRSKKTRVATCYESKTVIITVATMINRFSQYFLIYNVHSRVTEISQENN